MEVSMEDLIAIPPKDHPEYDDTLKALVASAKITKDVLGNMAMSNFEAVALFQENIDTLMKAKAVIDSWDMHLNNEE
jgi:hypothetical protein